ncbi:enoyl-CoA hydratase/isomerase family protein [Leucobacter sp. GX24907]
MTEPTPGLVVEGAERSGAQSVAGGTEPSVLVRRDGSILRITLNRPRAINAFNREMAEIVDRVVAGVDPAECSAILLDGAGERGFCGGGDIKAMAAGSVEDAVGFLRQEYAADYRVATAPVPVVGIMDGITMGGGIGLTGHASVRVVTERSRLAMPETRIGIVPDVGGHLLLARASGRLGELLAVTSGSMLAGDAVALGFADHFIPSERLPQLAAALAAGRPAQEVAEELSETPPEPELLADREWFDAIAEGALGDPHPSAYADPVGAAQRLVGAVEAASRQPGASPRVVEVAATLRAVCPTSVAVTLAQIDRTRREGLDLAAVLDDDLRVVGRLVARPDFIEGVRAQVIDKDGKPVWQPQRVEDLVAEDVAALLAR